jgi:hypothetical protein
MASASKSAYVAIPIECDHCQAKQIVHIAFHTGLVQMGAPQSIECLSCHRSFDRVLPNMIIGGPFPEV